MTNRILEEQRAAWLRIRFETEETSHVGKDRQAFKSPGSTGELGRGQIQWARRRNDGS